MAIDAGVSTATEAGIADAVLVGQVVTGSQTALAALYDRHAAAIFGRALWLIGDRGVAEDVVQETFLVLWTRAELFNASLGSLAGWLMTVARNRSIDRARGAARRVSARPFSSLVSEQSEDAPGLERLLASGDLLAAATAELGPEAALAAKESRETVVTALATLEGVERQVIMLAYQDGLSQSEIATHLGWPVGTVKTRTRRGLRKLRDVLEADGDWIGRGDLLAAGP